MTEPGREINAEIDPRIGWRLWKQLRKVDCIYFDSVSSIFEIRLLTYKKYVLYTAKKRTLTLMFCTRLKTVLLTLSHMKCNLQASKRNPNLINTLASVWQHITRESNTMSKLNTVSQRIGSVYIHIQMCVTLTFLSFLKYTDLHEYACNWSAFSPSRSSVLGSVT